MIRELEPLCWEERLRVGAVQPGEEKALRRPESSCQCLEGPTGKMGKVFSAGLVAIGQGVMALN